MSKFWNPHIQQLKPYIPGEQPKLARLIKLNTNENPYGPAPKVLSALQAAVGDSLRRYPDPTSSALKERIARYFSVQPNQVFVGNGSDEVLAHVFFALLKHDQPILFPDITYSFYPVYCKLYQIDYQTVPLSADFAIDAQNYQRPNGGIIFPNPNAPTGRLLALDQVETILQGNAHSVVVVDEAYVDFGGESAVTLIDRYPNLLVVQTLSKSRSLAGLRVGYAMGHPDLIEGLERVKDSFNSYPLDQFALAGAVASFDDEEYFRQTCAHIIATREQLVCDLSALGFNVIPSAANFIFARHPQHDAADLAAFLRSQSIIVRHFKLPRIEQFLRITIGTDDECAALVTALQSHML